MISNVYVRAVALLLIPSLVVCALAAPHTRRIIDHGLFASQALANLSLGGFREPENWAQARFSRETASKLQARMQRAMVENGLGIEFDDVVSFVPKRPGAPLRRPRDLSDRLWSSIDADRARHFDQMAMVEPYDGGIRLLVAIADVTSYVPKYSSYDRAAYENTKSIYTDIETYSMLPKSLTTQKISLKVGEKRMAWIVEMDVDPSGQVHSSLIYPARVRNNVSLTFAAVTAWLEHQDPSRLSSVSGEAFKVIQKNPHLQEQIRLQYEVSLALQRRRKINEPLTFAGDEVDLQTDQIPVVKKRDRGSQIIEEQMFAANEAVDRYLCEKGFPRISRFIRMPDDWPSIRVQAAAHGTALPSRPDGSALKKFLLEQSEKDPGHFADLMRLLVKSVGPAEYVWWADSHPSSAHEGFVFPGRLHATSPNRRYTDLVIWRLVRAAFYGAPCPYTHEELQEIVSHCNKMEMAVKKVRDLGYQMIAARAMVERLGEEFEGTVASLKSQETWVHLNNFAVQGRLVSEQWNLPLSLGSHLRVRVSKADPEEGVLEFEPVNAKRESLLELSGHLERAG